MKKRALSLLLALATVFSLTAPAFAEEAPVPAEEPVVTEEVPVMEPEEVVEVEEPVEVTEEPIVTEEPVVMEEPVVTEEPEIIDEEVEPDPVDSSVGAVGVCGGEGDGTNLTWVLSPDGVLTISGTGKMKDYTNKYLDDPAPWYNFDSQIEKAVIEAGVTTIGDSAFFECANMTSVTIPNSVVSIGGWALHGCTSLASVPIPSGVTSIGTCAFQSCNSLTSVMIPASVTSIAGDAFNAGNITDIYVANGSKKYTSVDGILFSFDRTELICYPQGKTAVSYAVPNTVKSIGEWAFANCFRLTSVTISNSVTSIGASAFSSCSNLNSVTLPASVTNIGSGAFDHTPWLEAQGDFVIVNCVLLKYQGSAANVTIPEGVTCIAGAAFYNCGSLKSVTIPGGVTNIGGNAFSYCDSLANVSLPNSVTSIGDNAFDSCTSLAAVTIPDSVTSIGRDVFYSCISLADVIIGNGVTSIGVEAFYNCTSLTNITIPNSVTGIGQAAFADCTSLGSITILNPSCAIGEPAPGYPTFSNATIKGYTGSTAEAYAKQYGYKFEALDNTPTVTPNPQLAAPTVKIAKVSNGIKVSWNKVSGAPRYMVYYKEGNGRWKKIGTTTATSYTRKAANLKNGTTYTFTVRCCANDKKTLLSTYKASDSLKYTSQLAAPTVKIAKVSTGIKVSWNKITGSPRYMVYYKEGNGAWKKIGTTTATTYTRAAKYLKNNVKYTFTVRCCAADKKTLLSTYKASNSLTYKK